MTTVQPGPLMPRAALLLGDSMADVDGHGMTDDATGLYKMSSTRKQRCEKGGDKGLQKQGKRQERSTTCGVFWQYK